ncbi:MAG: hypothetical protein IJP29_00265 [Lachnospiraceae bacterium]|nr:hypothetical protein [Lachnospiraceae bacterium]
MIRNKVSKIVSYLATASPFITIIVTLFSEPEIAEAIIGGGIIGCVIGSVLGIIALILNRGSNKLVMVLSILPMIPIGLFLLLSIPFLFYK